MKFMKLGTRPNSFITTETFRTISSEVSTDLKIEVDNSLYQLHKFPLLSKSSLLQKLCSGSKHFSDERIIRLPDFPGGSEAFEICAKFCYGITITISALNIVAVRCASEYLQMTDEIDRGNLIGKLEAFFKSCILRRWKDTLLTLHSTRKYPEFSEKLQITTRCIDAIASIVSVRPSKLTWSRSSLSKSWWPEDIAELEEVDLYWRIMVAIKSSAQVSDKIIGEAVKIYAYRWLLRELTHHDSGETSDSSSGEIFQEMASRQRLLLERIVCLLPMEKGSVSCCFMLKLLKAANLLSASESTRLDLARRIGAQLEEAKVNDLLIPSFHDEDDQLLYDVDIVMTMLDEFMLQGQSPSTSPRRDNKLVKCERRRSRSAENVDLEAMENGGARRSSSASHSAKLRVAKLIDGFLQEVARDPNLPLDKLIEIAEAVPEFARPDHGDLYRVIDTYLRAHPSLDKTARKRLCKILDCKRLSIEACAHAAQNELLPLRVVVQVLFFEQARAALSGAPVAELPRNLKEFLARTTKVESRNNAAKFHHTNTEIQVVDDDWSISGVNMDVDVPSKLQTLRMRLTEADDNDDDHVDDEQSIQHGVSGGLARSGSSRFKTLCSLPNKPKRMLSKLWLMNRSVSERQ